MVHLFAAILFAISILNNFSVLKSSSRWESFVIVLANLAKVSHMQIKISFHHFQRCRILKLYFKVMLRSVFKLIYNIWSNLELRFRFLVKISYKNSTFYFFSDRDECLLAGGNNCNASVETCENTEGGYICQCLPGYKKTDNHCKG